MKISTLPMPMDLEFSDTLLTALSDTRFTATGAGGSFFRPRAPAMAPGTGRSQQPLVMSPAEPSLLDGEALDVTEQDAAVSAGSGWGRASGSRVRPNSKACDKGLSVDVSSPISAVPPSALQAGRAGEAVSAGATDRIKTC